jgi:hypothetical protein
LSALGLPALRYQALSVPRAAVKVTDSADWPVWYALLYSILGPLSTILLTPVWMLGLSLLYVDERVRHEGYDIELMAARQLDELPDMKVTSPLGNRAPLVGT